MFSAHTAALVLGAHLPLSDGIHVSNTCQNFQVSTDQDASGSTVLEGPAGSMEECCDLCDSVEDCDAWAYASAWSTCYCKSGFEGGYDNPGIVLGVRASPPSPPSPGVLQLAMFRATESSSIGMWRLENNNVADVGGVLKYLHTEIIVEHEQNPSRTTRKYDIDVVGRWNLQVKNSPKILADPHMVTNSYFGPYLAFDAGKSTNPYYDDKFPVYGDWVGMQNDRDDPRFEADFDLWWASLGGFCPNLNFKESGSQDAPNPECVKYADPPSWANAQPWTMPLQGGLCSRGENYPTGEAGCVYTYDAPKAVTVDQMSGITAQDCGGHACSDWSEFRNSCSDVSLKRRFSQAGDVESTTYCVEYDIAPACARNCKSAECMQLIASGATVELGVPFWKGRCEAEANRQRWDVVESLFGSVAVLI